MDAWNLFHRFSQELHARVASSHSNSTSVVNSTLEEGEEPVPQELPKLKLSKSKRGSSLGGAATATAASLTSPVTEPTEVKKSAKKSSSTKTQERLSLELSSPSSSTNSSVLPTVPPPLTTSSSASVSAAKKSRVNINLKERFLWCLSELKLHQLKGEGVNGIQTCWPFVLAVDPIQYPSYYTIILQPMDLSVIERKIKGEKYPQLIHLLKDVELIRDNAYTFNPGDIFPLFFPLSLSISVSLSNHVVVLADMILL
jgi:hypothetical protein